MLKLKNEQLVQIKELSNTVVETRKELAILISEILGDDYHVASGVMNGNGNSIEIWKNDNTTQIAISTYRFTNPKSVAVKQMYDYTNSKVYRFDKYGNCTHCA